MSETKKVCWVQHASEWKFFIPIARALKRNGVDSVFVCKSLYAHEQYQEAGFESHIVVDLFDDRERLSIDVLEELDKKYGPPGIHAIGDSDVQMVAYFKNEQEKKHQLIGRAYKFWEAFLSEHKIHALLAPDSATFITRTAHNIARKKGMTFAQILIGPSDWHFAVDDVDESHVWSGFLKEIEKGVQPLTDAQIKMTKEFIDRRTHQSVEGLPLRFVPFSLLKSIRQYAGMWWYDRPKERRDNPVHVATLRYGRRRLMKKMIWKYVTQVFFKYDTPKDVEKFVYFPVFSGEEASYIVNDHYWARNEVSLIKEIAESLPIGHYLYVKEHPFNPGDLTYRQLQELKKVSNIRVLHPTVSSHDLIKRSAGIFVLQGTTGWESFLIKKPVISLSNPFFSYSSLVYKVDRPSDFAHALRKMIQNGDSIYEDNEDEWLWFIYSVISTCGQGMTLRSKPPFGYVEDDENADKIASYLIEKLLSKN